MPLRLPSILLAAGFFVGLPSGVLGFPSPEDIPVRSIGHSLLVAPVFVNGQGPFDFVIDTGTNTTLLDPALTTRLGLAAEGTENLKTLTGVTPVLRYHLASVAVGSNQVHDLLALSQPMSAVQKLDKRINGILGLEFLAHFSFGLDYAKLRLRLYDGDAPQKFHGGQRVAAQFIHDRLLLPVAFSEGPIVQGAAADQDSLQPNGISAPPSNSLGRSAGPSRARGSASAHLRALALDSGVSQILLFVGPLTASSDKAGITAAEEKQPTRGHECLAMLDSDSVCRENAAAAAGREPASAAPASQSVRVTTNQAEMLSRSIVLRSLGIGDLRLRNVPAVVLSGDVSTADPASDGLLPARLFRSFFFDRATSTVVLNPD